jgi:cell division protein FtsB
LTDGIEMKKKNSSPRKKMIAALIAVISLVMVAVFVLAVSKRLKTRSEQEEKIESLSQTVKDIEEENSKIQETIDNGENESYIERVAREDYNYVRPEERVYYDSEQE